MVGRSMPDNIAAMGTSKDVLRAISHHTADTTWTLIQSPSLAYSRTQLWSCHDRPPAAVSTVLQAGTLVRVRQRTYLVENVRTSEGLAPVVDLACIDDDAQGQRLSVIWPAEIDAKIVPPGRSALRA